MDDRAAFDFRYRVIRKLAALFPKCFFEHSSDRLPLKVGIGHELEALELQIDPQELSYALGWYTGSTGYLRAMKVGAARVGLNGTPTGVVSEADARHAAHEIDRRQARAAEKPAKPQASNAVTAKRSDRAGAGARAKVVDRKAEPKRLSLSDLRAAARRRKRCSTKSGLSE